MSEDERIRREQYFALRRAVREAAAETKHADPLDLLSLDEVAALTKRHRRTIEREVKAGVLRSVMLGRRRLIPRAELERYIESGYNVDVTNIEEARRDH